MTTLLIGFGQGSLPVVSYVKAVDWYLIVCYTLVIGAFAEYVLVNYIEIMSHQQTEGCSREAVRFHICCCLYVVVLMSVTQHMKHQRNLMQEERKCDDVTFCLFLAYKAVWQKQSSINSGKTIGSTYKAAKINNRRLPRIAPGRHFSRVRIR